MKKIKFTKMHGAGNDYIYVNTTSEPLPHPNDLAKKWSQYHFGVGSDGLILIGSSDIADFSMRMFNNDGSEGKMCGNGIRCVGKYIYDKQLSEKTTLSIETLSGIKILKLKLNEEGSVSQVIVDMGIPSLKDSEQIKVENDNYIDQEIIGSNGVSYKGTFVSMGNPHFVIFVDDIKSIELEKIGPILENNELFPQKCNIEFAEIIKPNTIRTRVWERGTGITMACGTGACATAVAATLTKRTDNKVEIIMDGGVLHIDYSQEHLFMTGPAEFVFEGEIEL